jgi:hypothetical protein
MIGHNGGYIILTALYATGGALAAAGRPHPRRPVWILGGLGAPFIFWAWALTVWHDWWQAGVLATAAATCLLSAAYLQRFPPSHHRHSE